MIHTAKTPACTALKYIYNPHTEKGAGERLSDGMLPHPALLSELPQTRKASCRTGRWSGRFLTFSQQEDPDEAFSSLLQMDNTQDSMWPWNWSKGDRNSQNVSFQLLTKQFNNDFWFYTSSSSRLSFTPSVLSARRTGLSVFSSSSMHPWSFVCRAMRSLLVKRSTSGCHGLGTTAERVLLSGSLGHRFTEG